MARPEGIFLEKNGGDGQPIAQKFVLVCCVQRKPDGLIPNSGDDILYLGAGHGTTISHLHDVICGPNNLHSGRIVGVMILHPGV